MKIEGCEIMKKSWIVAIVSIVVVLMVGGLLVGTYNSLAQKQEGVENEYANVDVALQRRADLIPNLVQTVKGYASHEQKAIDNVTQARTKLMNSKNIEDKAVANEELSNALDALMIVVENYPDLKANQNYIQLSDELAGTENRIAVARRDYNTAVKEYNSTIIKFPKNMIAGMFGFEKKPYFETEEANKKAPEVNFD